MIQPAISEHSRAVTQESDRQIVSWYLFRASDRSIIASSDSIAIRGRRRLGRTKGATGVHNIVDEDLLAELCQRRWGGRIT
jgi:hypothetical protein